MAGREEAREKALPGVAAPGRWLDLWAVRLAAAALLLLLALLAAGAWQGPDIFYHLFLGKQILAGGGFQPSGGPLVEQPQYVNIYWLFQVVVEGLFSGGGLVAASLFFIAAWLATAVVWARGSGAAQRPALGLPLALAATLVVSGRFEPRPEVVSYLLLSLQLYWLSHWDLTGRVSWRRALLFGASEAVWANVHGYFVLGPLLAGARLTSALLRREERRSWRGPALLLAVALAASCLSPFGARTWQFSLALWSFLRAVGGSIVEFGPPTGAYWRVWTVKLFWLLWGATLLAAAWLAARRRATPFTLMTALAGLALSATSARHLPLLPLLAMPLYRAALGTGEEGAAAGGRRAGARMRLAIPRGASGPGAIHRSGALAGAILTAGAALGLCAWVVGGGFHASLLGEGRFGLGLPAHTYPVGFAEHLRSRPWSGRLFNSAADGGYVEYFFPDVRIYMDSRYVDETIVREYFAGLVDPEAFARLHARHRFDGALLKIVDSPQLVLALLHDPRWRLAYADLQRAFFVAAAGPAGEDLVAGAQASPAAERPSSGALGTPPAAERPSSGALGTPLAAELHFYEGEDLRARVSGMPAIQWTGVLTQAPDRALLLAALEQFGRAPRIPSYIIQYALQYGIERRDGEVLELGRRMYPRVYARDRAGREAVDFLMRRSAPR